jgi:serine/threonine-protein kinase
MRPKEGLDRSASFASFGGRERPHDKAADCFSELDLPRRFGRYLLLRLIARGGMGQVFLAATTGVEGAERPVVLKVIRREHAKDPNFLARFLDEARVQSQLQHSGVAQIIEASSHDESGEPYVVMEYVEGRSLGNVRRRITEVGLRLRWEHAVAIGTLIGDALSYVHERCDASGRPLCIVHRDLSPHNVMIGYSGEAKIIDFGTAQAQNRRCHTVSGVVFAKPGYVAPEVARGEAGDSRVDLYAAGIMIWELCSGRRFLQGDAQTHTAEVARGERVLPPIAAHVGATPELDKVLGRMTATEREERYPSTRAATAALASLLKDAAPLPNGERGLRARVAELMYQLYPSQPGRSRREFARLVTAAREGTIADWKPLTRSSGLTPEPDPRLLAGTRYLLRREIGRGASSVVYEAEHLDLGRRVALKLLDAEHTHSREFSARFRREARALSRLQHPGLVRVHEFGQADDGRMFCVMELLEGRTLRALLEQDAHMPWKEALRIVRHACLALEVAHAHGIVHRDINPENVFVTDRREVKLIDFGLAKSADEVADHELDGSGPLTLFGTPEYMAPEQVAGGRVDQRADLYALGSVLYELLSGRLPFAGKSDAELLDNKLRGNPETLVLDAMPRSVARVVVRALARHPSRRFQTAADMALALAACLEEPTRRRMRRRTIGGAVVAGTMAFGVVFVVRQARPWLEALPASVPWLSPASTPPPRGSNHPPPPRQEPDPGEPRREQADGSLIEIPRVVIVEPSRKE